MELVTIKNKIYTIRGLQVMLDRDLAKLYNVLPIRLREQVKRNSERFPKNFMFQLTENEVKILVSQNAIPSTRNLGGHLPYVFTEQGVSMLSSVLRSKTAIKMSINIINAFVSMRKFISTNAQLFHRLDTVETKLIKHDTKFEEIFKAIEDRTIKPNKGIFYDGQVFDAYLFVSNVIKSAQKSIILIDNYIDESVLVLLPKRKKNIPVTIYSKNLSKQLKLDVNRFNAQYEPLNLVQFKHAHDRFLILDEKEVYHLGASLKDIGKKWFAFSKFEKEAITMLQKIEETHEGHNNK